MKSIIDYSFVIALFLSLSFIAVGLYSFRRYFVVKRTGEDWGFRKSNLTKQGWAVGLIKGKLATKYAWDYLVNAGFFTGIGLLLLILIISSLWKK